MSEEAEKPKCDVDGLMCQLQVRNLLVGMENLLGTETFKTQYPEFEGLGETVGEKIRKQEVTIKEAFERCGMGSPAEPEQETRVIPAAVIITEEEE